LVRHSIIASFSKQFGASIKPKITRLVQDYNIILNRSVAVIYAEKNDITGLQKLFTAGKTSPYDCDESGWPLLMVRTHLYLYVASLVYVFVTSRFPNKK
jgi:hypothetical protein